MIPELTGSVCLTVVIAVILSLLLTSFANSRWRTSTSVKEKSSSEKEVAVSSKNNTDIVRGHADGDSADNVEFNENTGTEDVNSDEPVMRCPFSGLAMPSMGSVHGDDPSSGHNQQFLSRALEDPVNYMQHIQGEVKRVRTKAAERSIASQMTADQREQERKTQQEQMEAIFKLMREQEEVFGVNSMDDMKQQMKLYM